MLTDYQGMVRNWLKRSKDQTRGNNMKIMPLHLTTEIKNFPLCPTTMSYPEAALRAVEQDEQIPVLQHKDETCRETAAVERVEINVKQ